MQDFGKQAVVAIPLPFVVEGDQEQVSLIEEIELCLAVAVSTDSITEGGAEPFEKRGAQQKVLHLRSLTAQDFIEEIVSDIVMAAAEGSDEVSGIVMVEQRVGSELQAGDPAFGASMQEGTVLWGERESHDLAQVGRCFLRGEAQIAGTQFEQGALAPQARQGERGVLAGGKDEMELRRKMLQQKGQGRMN